MDVQLNIRASLPSKVHVAAQNEIVASLRQTETMHVRADRVGAGERLDRAVAGTGGDAERIQMAALHVVLAQLHQRLRLQTAGRNVERQRVGLLPSGRSPRGCDGVHGAVHHGLQHRSSDVSVVRVECQTGRQRRIDLELGVSSELGQEIDAAIHAHVVLVLHVLIGQRHLLVLQRSHRQQEQIAHLQTIVAVVQTRNNIQTHAVPRLHLPRQLERSSLHARGKHFVVAIVQLGPRRSVIRSAQSPLSRIGRGARRRGLDHVAIKPLASIVIERERQRQLGLVGHRDRQIRLRIAIHNVVQIVFASRSDRARHRQVHRAIHLALRDGNHQRLEVVLS